MDQQTYIAQMNVDNYRRKLQTEQNEATRRQIVQLLAAEESKLAALNDPPARRGKKDGP